MFLRAIQCPLRHFGSMFIYPFYIKYDTLVACFARLSADCPAHWKPSGKERGVEAENKGEGVEKREGNDGKTRK